MFTTIYSGFDVRYYLAGVVSTKSELVQFECPRVTHVHTPIAIGVIHLWRVPIPIFCPCCFLPSSPRSIKKWFIMGGGWVKRRKLFGTKKALEVANGPVWMPRGKKPLGVIHFWAQVEEKKQPFLFSLFPGIRKRALLSYIPVEAEVHCWATKN